VLSWKALVDVESDESVAADTDAVCSLDCKLFVDDKAVDSSVTAVSMAVVNDVGDGGNEAELTGALTLFARDAVVGSVVVTAEWDVSSVALVVDCKIDTGKLLLVS
jgi:hypothetical protein